jgi:hypothetical protein
MNDPVYGKTWKMNKGQSVLTASSTPTAETRLYEKVVGGYKLTVSGMHDGQPYEWGYTAQYEGKPSPVYGRSDVDAIEKHQVSNLITIGSFTNKGRIVGAYRRATSIDGKTLTVVASGRRQDGTTYFDVIKYKPLKGGHGLEARATKRAA